MAATPEMAVQADRYSPRTVTALREVWPGSWPRARGGLFGAGAVLEKVGVLVEPCALVVVSEDHPFGFADGY